MSILSLYESNAHKAEADRICETVAANASALRTTSYGNRFKLNGIAFRLFETGRNAVYRLVADGPWFIKMPRITNGEVIEREILGATTCSCHLANCEGYHQPHVVRASIEHGFVLTSAIVGRMAKHAVYLASFALWHSPLASIQHQFGAIGNALARLHNADVPSERASDRSAYLALQIALERAVYKDRVFGVIEESMGSIPDTDRREMFVHGNFKLANVLLSREGITIIDFENCGRGSPYDDLALLASQLLWDENAIHVPARGFRLAREAVFEGYRCERDIDSRLLRLAIGRYISTYYVLGFCCGRPLPTIAGMPVSRRKAERLVQSFVGE